MLPPLSAGSMIAPVLAARLSEVIPSELVKLLRLFIFLCCGQYLIWYWFFAQIKFRRFTELLVGQKVRPRSRIYFFRLWIFLKYLTLLLQILLLQIYPGACLYSTVGFCVTPQLDVRANISTDQGHHCQVFTRRKKASKFLQCSFLCTGPEYHLIFSLSGNDGHSSQISFLYLPVLFIDLLFLCTTESFRHLAITSQNVQPLSKSLTWGPVASLQDTLYYSSPLPTYSWPPKNLKKPIPSLLWLSILTEVHPYFYLTI